MPEDRNPVLIYIALGIGLLTASWLSSALFFLLSGMNPASALPWSVWQGFTAWSDPQIQSRLFVAVGFPHLALASAIFRLLKPDDQSDDDARWATGQDIAKAGLCARSGLVLGKKGGRYLISDTPTHCLVVAPTRSGKGVGLVIPNLLSWNGSLVCLDIKQENYRKTAGFRQSFGHQTFLWAPLSEDGCSHRFNPFDEIRKDPLKRIGDLMKIATILIKEPATGDGHWVIEGRALFVGLALYVLDHQEMPSTIGSVYRLLGTEQELGDVVRHIVKSHREIDPDMKTILLNFANKAAKERSGVKSAISEALQLWKTPEIDAATSASDFSLKDLRRKRVAVYVGVATGDIPTVAPLLNLFFEQIMTTLTTRPPGVDEPHQVLIMLDEFHMLGRMDTVANVFTLAGGYNCRVMAVVQGLTWIDDVYGASKRNGILSVCAHRVFFSANDLETARYVSEACGERMVRSVSTSTRRAAIRYEPPTENVSKRTVPLITRAKTMRLPKNRQIILVESGYPVWGQKIVYYQDRSFKKRELPAPAVPMLEIVRKKPPEFDIQQSCVNSPPQPDPNQSKLFDEDDLTGELD